MRVGGVFVCFSYFLQLLIECRDILCNGFPEQILVYRFVLMCKEIPHTAHLRPRQFCVGTFEVL